MVSVFFDMLRLLVPEGLWPAARWSKITSMEAAATPSASLAMPRSCNEKSSASTVTPLRASALSAAECADGRATAPRSGRGTASLGYRPRPAPWPSRSSSRRSLDSKRIARLDEQVLSHLRFLLPCESATLAQSAGPCINIIVVSPAASNGCDSGVRSNSFVKRRVSPETLN